MPLTTKIETDKGNVPENQSANQTASTSKNTSVIKGISVKRFVEIGFSIFTLAGLVLYIARKRR
jgi:hypothetical protein